MDSGNEAVLCLPASRMRDWPGVVCARVMIVIDHDATQMGLEAPRKGPQLSGTFGGGHVGSQRVNWDLYQAVRDCISLEETCHYQTTTPDSA